MLTLPGREKKTEVYHPYRKTIYPDGYYEEMVCSRPVFHAGGWERGGWDAAGAPRSPQKPRHKLEGENTPKGEQTPENAQRAVRRACAGVRRLAHCADMRYFVTLTLNAERIDRYDPVEIVRKMGQWADNQVRRKGLCYVLVPEHHKDGAVHFHGFFNGALEVVDSGTIRRPGHKRPCKPRSRKQRELWLAEGGQAVYNLPGWKLGFSTAIELYGDKDSAISYTCKYLTKELSAGGKIGGRWYYHGGAFDEPRVEYGDTYLQDLPEGAGYYVFHVDDAGLAFGIRRGKEE